MEITDTGKIAKIRSVGFFTKGIVYVLLGTLTFMAAFGWGGEISSSSNVIGFLLDLPLGQTLVGVTSLGLLSYSLWRFFRVYMMSRELKSGKKLKPGFKMLRYIYSGIFYCLIAYSFAKPLINTLTGNGTGENDQNDEEKAALWELLSNNWGKSLIWTIAALVAAQAIQQFYLAYSAKFMKKIDNYPSIKNEYDFIRRSGQLGYVARGIVFGILSYFMIQVILSHNANAYKDTEGALEYLLTFNYGPFLLGAVALGLTGYGIFNVMVARHADLTKTG